MKRLILVAILLFPAAMLAYWVHLGTTMPQQTFAKTVEDRLAEFGPAARARLRPYFDAKQVPYPPARLVLVGLKAEKVLQLYAASSNQPPRFLRSYPILAASGMAGPKLREGDQQVPEGIYPVESLNPNSKFHLSLRLGYPNQFDLQQAHAEGRDNPGNDIMIHGGAASVGCLAMGDEAAEDLFVLAADTGLTNITVILSPVDFRAGRVVPSMGKLPSWTDSLYQTIKSKLNELPPAK